MRKRWRKEDSLCRLGNICGAKSEFIDAFKKKKNEEWDKTRDCRNLKAFIMFYDRCSQGEDITLFLCLKKYIYKIYAL